MGPGPSAAGSIFQWRWQAPSSACRLARPLECLSDAVAVVDVGCARRTKRAAGCQACQNLPKGAIRHAETTVIAFRQPEAIDDPLSEVAREGARRMLAQVLIAEADSFVAYMSVRSLPRYDVELERRRRTDARNRRRPLVSGGELCRNLGDDVLIEGGVSRRARNTKNMRAQADR
jgi:hypothetical protein